MKNISIITLLILTVVSVAACTKKPAPQVTPTNAPAEQQTQSNTVAPTEKAMATEQPVASFAATNDEDVKAMDKAIGGVDLNEYKSDSLNDL